MIGVIDYGAGNLFSVANALQFLGVDYCLSGAPEILSKADALILPGVGAFPSAMEKLCRSGLRDCILEEAKKKPFLGICLGMQMLFDLGHEFGETAGLGLIPGEIVAMKPQNPSLKIPHMGWNSLHLAKPSPLLEGVEEGSWVYFVHSFEAVTSDEYLVAWADYGGKVPALVQRGFVYGAQFHPEKSGKNGLKILENFTKIQGVAV